jgi:hypothetical protein
LIVGLDTGPGKVVHTTADFYQDVAAVDQVQEIILGNDGLGNRGDCDAHVFFARHGIAQLEIFGIEAENLSAWGGDDAVEENFDCAEVS